MAVIARTGFFVLCSVFKEHDPRELGLEGPARTRSTRRCGSRRSVSPEDFFNFIFSFRGTFHWELASGAEEHSSEWSRPTQLRCANDSNSRSGGHPLVSAVPLRVGRRRVAGFPAERTSGFRGPASTHRARVSSRSRLVLLSARDAGRNGVSCLAEPLRIPCRRSPPRRVDETPRRRDH